jgi:outer membrane protein assembly factor BamB
VAPRLEGVGVNLPSGDLSRTGRFPGPGLPSRPRVRLRVPGERPSVPTVVGGTAFFGDAEGGVHAVDLADGDALWRFRHDLRHADGSAALSSVAALPAVSDDLVFVEAGGQVFAHDRRTGEPRWRVPEISSHHPVVVGGLLVVVHDLHAAAAYDGGTGDKRWTTESDDLGFGLLAAFAPVAGGRMFLTEGVEGNHTHGGLHAFDLATGALEWGHHEEFVACDRPRCEGDDLMIAPNHAVHARGLVWAVRSRYCDGIGEGTMELVGFDPADGTGRVVLTEPAGAETTDVFLGAPVFGADLVYCTSGVRLHALDPESGRLVWSRRFDAPIVGTPLLAGPILHLAAGDGRLHAIDARTGEPRWELAPDEPTSWSAEVDSEYAEAESPLTLADGTLFVATDTAVLALS